MRIRRHHDDDAPVPPAWIAGKPVWSVVHIEAPKASELAHPVVDEHVPHAAA